MFEAPLALGTLSERLSLVLETVAEERPFVRPKKTGQNPVFFKEEALQERGSTF